MNNPVEIYQPVNQGGVLVRDERHDPEQGQSDTLDLRVLLDALKRRRGLMWLVFLGVMLATILIMIFLPWQYTATSQVVIDVRTAQLTPPTDQVLPAPAVSADLSTVVDTEAQVIGSNEMAEAVDTALSLDTAPMWDPHKPATGPVAFFRSVFMPKRANPRIASKALQHIYVIQQLKYWLTVARVGTTFSIQISFESLDPLFAKRVADEYAIQYSKLQALQAQAANQKAAGVLRDKLLQLARQADADTRAVQEYRIRHNLLSTNAQSLTEAELSTYNTELAGARAQATEDQSRLATAERQQRAGGGAMVGEAITSPVVAALRTQRAQVAASLANLQGQYGPAYPDVVKYKQQLADLDTSINKETESLMHQLQAHATVSTDRLGSIAGSRTGARGVLESNNEAMIDFQALQLKAQSSQALYDTYLSRYKETAAQEGTETSQARTVSLSDLPVWPSMPSLIITPILGLALGITAAIASAIIAELLFAGLTTGSEVEQRLGIHYLGSVPTSPRWKFRNFVPTRIPPAIEQVVTEPMSAFAESFRHIITTIDFIAEGRKQLVMMTSALPLEGKTTAAICLARSIALRGASVLLIDCDLRRRSLNGLSSDITGPGLIEVLRSEAPLNDAIVTDEETGAALLLLKKSKEHDGAILVGQHMIDLIAQARSQFDYIILDTAPILPVTETRILAGQADAVVILVRWRKTADHAVRTALRMLPAGRAYVAGVVLSRVNMRKQARFGHGDANAYYKQYKSYYS